MRSIKVGGILKLLAHYIMDFIAQTFSPYPCQLSMITGMNFKITKMIKEKIMIIGIRREMANEYRDRVSLRSLSACVVALCFTRMIPAGIMSAISTILRVQKPAAASTDAATIATSTSLTLFML